MNCPKCNTEMVEGSLNSNGNLWVGRTPWIFTTLIKFSKAFVVQAFRCPQCNKIELVAAQSK